MEYNRQGNSEAVEDMVKRVPTGEARGEATVQC